ncbi:bifunctional (p)ppGpp synthetase/guanosine-3',5'-bis(diphosphate) 3'-pyrophosphohydrolase [archaeon]|jgi:(p)ppGpp synthase/HD superfamily hydrolase|nr:bifunctional (p)ppGpp synthetase/guanosine-3',5'-bis(diphosphate) 3'-pyrophosphohydrolase [archaeon]MBT6824387.1 bifunctional (p)ppGpp synthetase/guanosine-3',5'-bis(diphosphate) 3'-pyrophosphohydrolase [archaeon]MBT7106937.1 bifunctional (p)ppGpp synthetase/guanosine-3',5'-bis(diphosphate) 3'-pyrophosphohydrolase [archaeon]MBT7297490.1 bifunctional (p)ppGpp synthetase/guanosine-3',5'-bis(diphosphate) 3'-pyrophosphohydrolase [archaeon]
MEDITKAFEFASKAHGKQKRRIKKAPYIIHPMDVAIILMKNHAPDKVVIAGLLHDTVEDTKTTIEDIEENFGKEVARLVKNVTEPAKLEKKKIFSKTQEIWEEKKTHTINFIKTADKNTKLLSCADKLSNIRSMIEDEKTIKKEIWDNFHAPKEKQKWYYESMQKSFATGDNIKDRELFKQFKKAVKKVFG